MAKQTKADAVVIDESVLEPAVENSEEIAEEKVEEVVVTETIVPKAMNVEVIPTKTFNCNIGGVRYSFVKNQKQKVPADVERFLRERDKIK